MKRSFLGVDPAGDHVWRDPRRCSPEQFGGPLPVVIDGDLSAGELEAWCSLIGDHTLLAVSALDPFLTWERGGVRSLRPDVEAGVVWVSTPTADDPRLAAAARERWPDGSRSVDAGVFSIAVPLRPLRPAVVGAALLDIVDEADTLEQQAGVVPDVSELWPVLDHGFCGNPHLALIEQYANADEHPLAGDEREERQ